MDLSSEPWRGGQRTAVGAKPWVPVWFCIFLATKGATFPGLSCHLIFCRFHQWEQWQEIGSGQGRGRGMCLPSLHLLSQQLTFLCGPSFFCKDLVRTHLPSGTLPLDAANLFICPSTLWLLDAPSWGISSLVCVQVPATLLPHTHPSFLHYVHSVVNTWGGFCFPA